MGSFLIILLLNIYFFIGNQLLVPTKSEKTEGPPDFWQHSQHLPQYSPTDSSCPRSQILSWVWAVYQGWSERGHRHFHWHQSGFGLGKGSLGNSSSETKNKKFWPRRPKAGRWRGSYVKSWGFLRWDGQVALAFRAKLGGPAFS